MYTLNQIKKFIFFDIETISGHKSQELLKEKNERLNDLWEKRVIYLKDKYPDAMLQSTEEVYYSRAALHSEFSQIICVSFAMVQSETSMSVKSIFGHDEKDVLIKVLNLIDKLSAKIGPGFKLVGHNIKRFDVPVLCKRSLINGVALPDVLQIHNLKPWEFPMIDTAEIWSHGAWQEGFTSLDLLCAVLGIPSPKGDLSGDKVQDAYYIDNDLPRIAKYCEHDAAAVANCVMKLSGMDFIER